jgi:hypothetical protein
MCGIWRVRDMLKLAVNVMIASMLLAFPIAFCISQTTGAGIGEKITVSQRIIAEDNTIVNGDIYQVSTVKTGDSNPGGSSGGNSDEPGDDSGGSFDDGSDNGSGRDNGSGGDNGAGTGGSSDEGHSGGSNSGSSGTHQDNSIEGSSEGFREAEVIISEQLLGSTANPVVLNEIHPRLEAARYEDEHVELYNTGKNPVNVSLWYMKNITGQVIGTIRDREIPPHGFLVVDVIGLIGDYQAVTLFDSGNTRVDSVIYMGARSHNGSCYARVPDGADTWEWATCTLGSSNRQR